MNGDFTDYKPGYYTVQFAQADDFRNKDKSPADLAKWGTAYAVKFEGDAGTYYWSSRSEPQEGQRVYGHVAPSKTGKSMNFRRDEEPKDSPQVSLSPTNSIGQPAKSNAYLKDVTDLPDRWMGRLLNFYDVQNLVKDGKPTLQFQQLVETARVFTEESLRMIENIRGGSQESVAHPAPQPIKAEELAPATSLGDQFRNRNVTNPVTTEFSDRDIPEDY